MKRQSREIVPPKIYKNRPLPTIPLATAIPTDEQATYPRAYNGNSIESVHATESAKVACPIKNTKQALPSESVEGAGASFAQGGAEFRRMSMPVGPATKQAGLPRSMSNEEAKPTVQLDSVILPSKANCYSTTTQSASSNLLKLPQQNDQQRLKRRSKQLSTEMKVAECPFYLRTLSFGDIKATKNRTIKVQSQLFLKFSKLVSQEPLEGFLELQFLKKCSRVSKIEVSVKVIGLLELWKESNEFVRVPLPNDESSLAELKSIAEIESGHRVSLNLRAKIPDSLPSTFHSTHVAIRYFVFSSVAITFKKNTHVVNSFKEVEICRQIELSSANQLFSNQYQAQTASAKLLLGREAKISASIPECLLQPGSNVSIDVSSTKQASNIKVNIVRAIHDINAYLCHSLNNRGILSRKVISEQSLKLLSDTATTLVVPIPGECETVTDPLEISYTVQIIFSFFPKEITVDFPLRIVRVRPSSSSDDLMALPSFLGVARTPSPRNSRSSVEMASVYPTKSQEIHHRDQDIAAEIRPDKLNRVVKATESGDANREMKDTKSGNVNREMRATASGDDQAAWGSTLFYSRKGHERTESLVERAKDSVSNTENSLKRLSLQDQPPANRSPFLRMYDSVVSDNK